ncbi:MAG: type II toxin-antitoxin system CcdA family antitoxin [Nitrosarchaeum sp.]|nr:type II toxin-antitoxin system CcdA family antitoxin [Nitrosarchaeum sp.]
MIEEIDEKKEQKQKLTLGISKDVIEKAKATGINISSITEQLLKVMTYDPKKNTTEDLARVYEIFFEAIKPVLKKYGAMVRVGSFYEGNPDSQIFHVTIDLSSSNLYRNIEELEEYHEVAVLDVVSDLFNPTKILENLLESLIKAAEKNTEKMKEFEIALRIVGALTNKSSTESTKNSKNMRRG